MTYSGDLKHMLNEAQMHLMKSNSYEDDTKIVLYCMYQSFLLHATDASHIMRLMVQTFLLKYYEDSYPESLLTAPNCDDAHVCLYLLICINLAQEVNVDLLESLVSCPETTLPCPEWLSTSLGNSLKPFKDLSIILCIAFNAKIPWCNEISSHYLKSVILLKNAVEYYQKGESNKCLKVITSHQTEHCSSLLLSWFLLLEGLALKQLDQFKGAILKFKKALQTCDQCFPAIYCTASIIKRLSGCCQDYFDCLNILLTVKISKQMRDIQSALINLMHQTSQNISDEALYLMAANNLALKNYKSAKNQFCELLEAVQVDPPLTMSLLIPEDCCPTLPNILCIKAQYLMACLGDDDATNVEENKCKIAAVNWDYYKTSIEEKCVVLSGFIMDLAKLEAMQNTASQELMIQFSLLEQQLHWVSASCYDAWSCLILLLKSCLYERLRRLHVESGHQDAGRYFERLYNTCYGSCLEFGNVDEDLCGNYVYRLFVRNTFEFLKLRSTKM